MPIKLMPHQEEALHLLDNGKILYGGTGSGKSITALAYYVKNESPKPIYVITTAKKRDSFEWVGDAAEFAIGRTDEETAHGVLTIDSWNNIGRYVDIEGAFFIFDEQRVVGYGAWTKSFIKIARRNRWILLSATPGDVWKDYAPVFIANGWYKNITDFHRRHVVWMPHVKFPKILRYVGEDRLERLRSEVLVEMPFVNHTRPIMNYVEVDYDLDMIKLIQMMRWDYHNDKPIADVAALWRYMRLLVNTHPDRMEHVHMILAMHPKLIVFYNFDYELELLRGLKDFEPALTVAEWNGHRHQAIPNTDKWVYLVQYTSGSEGWNCISTDAMMFYSLTYSYRAFRQSLGRIDRLNSPFEKLYYYVLKSDSIVDKKIFEALKNKEDFNERDALKEFGDLPPVGE